MNKRTSKERKIGEISVLLNKLELRDGVSERRMIIRCIRSENDVGPTERL